MGQRRLVSGIRAEIAYNLNCEIGVPMAVIKAIKEIDAQNEKLSASNS